jgi:hypothetical protein
MPKSEPGIGCCGLECGLCPRFYTEGSSRCPGCGGADFENRHPSCSVKTCCADKHGLEVCSLCAEFPCRRFAVREKIERDSFVTHKRIFPNHEMIKTCGFTEFIARLDERILILKKMLSKYDDGRSKSFYCTAAALLSASTLRSALADVSAIEGDVKIKAKALREILNGYADKENIELKLIK